MHRSAIRGAPRPATRFALRVADRVSAAVAACAVGLVLAAAGSPVQASPLSEQAQDDAARYRAERAACLQGISPQGRKTCLYEAESAHAAQRKGLLRGEPAQTLLDNGRQRCQIQPEGQARSDCELRLGDAAEVSGSVAGGGLLRQLTTREPGPPLSVPAPQALPTRP
jgi:hypothetical protein